MSEILPELLKNKKLNLAQLQSRISDLNSTLEQLSSENKYNSAEYIDSTIELNELGKVLNNIEQAQKLINQHAESTLLLNDPDFSDLAKSDLAEIEPKIEELTKFFEVYILEPLRNDEKRAIVEIKPGVGGVEASLFAEELFRLYTRYCNISKLTIEQLSLIYDDAGGIKESTFLVDNKGSYGALRFESGVHRVQRVPKTESAGRIHTSTASVVVMPQIDLKDVEIKEGDLRIDVFRAGGPGGQSVNTTDSAVRITHLPTGITVSCQKGKSQHKNKEMAMSVLISKLNEIEENNKHKEEKELRNASVMGGDRSAKIRTFNFPQSRVTDHRINKSWFNLAEIMDGEIAPIVNEVASEIRARINNS